MLGATGRAARRAARSCAVWCALVGRAQLRRCTSKLCLQDRARDRACNVCTKNPLGARSLALYQARSCAARSLASVWLCTLHWLHATREVGRFRRKIQK